MRRLLLLSVFGLSFASLSITANDPKPIPKSQRFDLVVREDIFNGFKGDTDAMARGIKACDDALAKNPKHAEAMVWRGAAHVFQSGELLGKGKQADGLKLWMAGLKEMDEAVMLEPKSVGVRIPRAAVLVNAGKAAPKAIGEPLLKKALADFQTIETEQKEHLDKVGSHPLGELRMGLADLYRVLGDKDKSVEQLEAVKKALPDSKYAKRATEWLAAKPDAKLHHSCIGCHTKE